MEKKNYERPEIVLSVVMEDVITTSGVEANTEDDFGSWKNTWFGGRE